MNINLARLEKIINECKKHKMRLNEASVDMKSFMPLDIEKYDSLTKDQIRIIDQFLFRFSKLQDSVGNKLFKTILLVLGEDLNDMAFIDIFNRLEKLNLVNDIESWFELRQIRNDLSHNYEDDKDELCEILNNIYSKKDQLFSYFDRIYDYFSTKIKTD